MTEHIGAAWMELCGLVIVKKEEAYQKMTLEELTEIFRTEYSIKKETHAEILEGVLKGLASENYTIKE